MPNDKGESSIRIQSNFLVPGSKPGHWDRFPSPWMNIRLSGYLKTTEEKLKGLCPVSKLALMHKLTQRGSGNAVIIVPGGASESLLSRPGVSMVYLKNRQGFVKLALKTGAYLVPSYTFGENETYNQEIFPEGTWLRFFQKNFQKIGKRILGINFCTIHGRGLTRGSWGFLPFNQPITTVVGEPLPVPKILDPDKETIAKYLELYISALHKLFDQHKAKYGFSKTQELTIL